MNLQINFPLTKHGNLMVNDLPTTIPESSAKEQSGEDNQRGNQKDCQNSLNIQRLKCFHFQ